jgi:tetratricopeptide (TPR) repeat protein
MYSSPYFHTWLPGERGYKEHIDRKTYSNDHITAIKEQTNQLKSALRQQNPSYVDQAQKIIASNEQIISALDEGFNRIAEINQRGFNQVTSAIEDLHSDMNYFLGVVIQNLEYQNALLRSILSTLERPLEIRVEEYYNKGCHFIKQGFLENAIKCFKKSVELNDMGEYFFPSYYQLGLLYLEGKDETINITNPKIANDYLLLANKYGSGIHRAIMGGGTSVPQVGQVYEARIQSIEPFGAYVEFMFGKEGIVPISEISDKRVKSMEGFNVGDKIKVKLLEIDGKGKFRLSQKAVFTDSRPFKVHPFSSLLADCKLFLSQSYYYQLTGSDSSEELELIKNAIKYCEEAVALNPNLSQGFYHLAKYYSYAHNINALRVNFQKAIELDRNYLFALDPANNFFYDAVFEPHREMLLELVTHLSNEKRAEAKAKLNNAMNDIKELDAMNTTESKKYANEFIETKRFVILAEKDFNTGTYFGYDDCKIKLQTVIKEV